MPKKVLEHAAIGHVAVFNDGTSYGLILGSSLAADNSSQYFIQCNGRIKIFNEEGYMKEADQGFLTEKGIPVFYQVIRWDKR